ncbi:hypothetical protein RRG08_033618 [Elysia crispata]|uniref:Uncharacterized protein n=1 Tax=Elysia crispata TaxID=231223 RepID=A0AAE0XS76_9GAST|nr:hypothetical protein RRG08_033618 [Elysia crispata]
MQTRPDLTCPSTMKAALIICLSFTLLVTCKASLTSTFRCFYDEERCHRLHSVTLNYRRRCCPSPLRIFMPSATECYCVL